MQFRECIKLITTGNDLSFRQSETICQIILNGGASPAQIATLLTALHMKGESRDEISGFLSTVQAKTTKISSPDICIDTCGTGGDEKKTFNISTATAILVSKCGIPVAKHCGGAASSNSGSADLLRHIGYDLSVAHEDIQREIYEKKLGFMFASKFNKSKVNLSEIRKDIGIRTIFNIVNPLNNPANANFRLIGTYDRKFSRVMAECLLEIGVKCAWIVNSDDGMDELSVFSQNHVTELKNGLISEFYINPSDYGLHQDSIDISISDIKQSAKIYRAIFNCEYYDNPDIINAYRNIILLNAAACIAITRGTRDLNITEVREFINQY